MSVNGKLQLGLNGIAYYNEMYQFINVWKCASLIQVLVSGVQYTTGNAPGTSLSAWDGYLDANGDLVNPLPAAATQLTRIFYAQAAAGAPAGMSRLGQQWVLKFDGTASTVTISMDNVVRVGNRVTCTWGDITSNKQIVFSGIDHNDPPRNIRFCEARFEAKLDVGDIWNPDYVQLVRFASGIIRFMGVQCINDNRTTTTYAGIPTEAYYNWSSDPGSSVPRINSGVPISSIWKLSNITGSKPWVCIPNVFGTYKTGLITGITNANPAVITAPGHNFVNGDQVIPYRIFGMTNAATVTMTVASPCVVTWTAHGLLADSPVFFTGGTLPTGITASVNYYVIAAGLAADTFQISATPGGAAVNTSGSQSGTHTGTSTINRSTFTVANAVANTSFELSGAGSNTTPLAAYGGAGYLTSPYSLSRITTEMTLLATEMRNNTAPGIVTIYEFLNEHWNTIFDGPHWLLAQAEGTSFANEDYSKMYGYLAAHCMKVVRDVYGTANRSKWKGIIGSQTANAGVSTSAISGINQYITDNAPTLTIRDLFDDLAITGYFGTPFIDNSSSSTVTMTIASPCVVTHSFHGRIANNPVKFSTTGTLPTGITAGTIYFLVPVNNSTYQIAATPGGASINTSGSQSGTHSVVYCFADLTRQWMNDSTSRFNSGLERTKYSYFNRIVNEDTLDGRNMGTSFNIARLVSTYWPPHKTIADANGLTFTQYEGGPSYDLVGTGMAADSQYLEFWPQCCYADEVAADALVNYQSFLDIGGHHPAQFVDIAPITITPPSFGGSFGSLRFLGSLVEDSTARWSACVQFNAAAVGRLR